MTVNEAPGARLINEAFGGRLLTVNEAPGGRQINEASGGRRALEALTRTSSRPLRVPILSPPSFHCTRQGFASFASGS